MSVGILLITHVGIATALLDVATTIFGSLSLSIAHLEISEEPEPASLLHEATTLVQKLDTGLGVLILTDMFGSTPSNIAQELQRLNLNIKIVCGLNLPMLSRILNYPHLTLSQITEKAISGAKAGVFEQHCDPLPLKNKETRSVKKAILVMEP